MKHDFGKPISNRSVYGKVITEMGKEFPNIVVLNADLAKATGSDTFKEKFPERYFNVGIAEANMMTIAAGLATTGLIPFVSTFAVFASMRAVEQLRNSIAYPSLNVRIIATNAGIETGADGATHQSIEDIAIIRAIPNMTLVSPSDPIITEKALIESTKYQGPIYFRFGRLPNEYIYNLGEKFEFGKGKVLRDGKDIALISTGNTVIKALKARDILKKQDIEAAVIDMISIKPIDSELILNYAKKTKKIMTIEDHNVIGGLGSAVSELLSSNLPTKIKMLGINDRFGMSARKEEELFSYFNINADNIVKEVIDFLN